MTTIDADPAYPAYSHPLVSWGSVILGAVAAVAIGVLLNLLVAVFDGVATLHEISKTGQPGDNALLLGVFGGIANLIALFTGGFIAARSANHPDHHDGMLHGLGVWAVSFVVVFALLGSGATRALGAAINEADMSAPFAAGEPPQAGAGVTPAQPQPPVSADQQKQAEADAAAASQSEGQAIAKGATTTAFFGFAAMLVGLVAALWGGVAGSRHPQHFAVRPRRRVIVV